MLEKASGFRGGDRKGRGVVRWEWSARQRRSGQQGREREVVRGFGLGSGLLPWGVGWAPLLPLAVFGRVCLVEVEKNFAKFFCIFDQKFRVVNEV